MFKIKVTKEIAISEQDTILSVMKKINEGNFRFQIVIKNKRLVGTITDGDIRRAILSKKNLNEKIETCMQKNPTVGYLGKEDTHKALLSTISGTVKYLPIIDNNKILKFVIIDEKKHNKKTALIMAGGMGSRLGRKTKNTPKPLLKVGKKPILEYLLEKLEHAQYEKVYISTHYLHKKIENYIKKRNSKIDIQILVEKEPLGTAGSINLIPKNKYDSLTVINGDLITGINLDALNSFHYDQENDITITVAKYEYNIPFGLVNFDKSQNMVNILEKPNKEEFVLSGIYCLNKNVCRLVKKKKIDMVTLIDAAHNLKKRIGVFPIHEYWKDVGNPNDFDMVNSRYSSVKDKS